MLNVGICGSYGGFNVGDEAILTVALEQLRATLPGAQLTVFTRDVEHTRARHRVERAIDARGALRDELAHELGRLDLLLLGGGGLLYDTEAEAYLHPCRIAQDLGVCTATYAVGAGPLRRVEDRRAVADILNRMAAVTVRDTRSRRLLEEIGARLPITVTADPALLLTPQAPADGVLARLEETAGRRLVGVSVREPGAACSERTHDVYYGLLADAADYAADRFDADVLFIPMERCDVTHAHRVIGAMGMPDRATVLNAPLGPRETLALVSGLDLAVGMRLHFAIFAAMAGVPVLALPYASKVTAFLEDALLPGARLTESGGVGALLATIDRLWDQRREHTERVRARIGELQDMARQTPHIVAGLLGTPRLAA